MHGDVLISINGRCYTGLAAADDSDDEDDEDDEEYNGDSDGEYPPSDDEADGLALLVCANVISWLFAHL